MAGRLLYVRVYTGPVGAGLVLRGQAQALPMQMVTRPALSECGRHKAEPRRCSPLELWETSGLNTGK